MWSTIVIVLHAFLPPLEPPCGCSPNYSPPVSCSATALLHSCLCKVKQIKRNTENEEFCRTPQKWEKPRCTTNPSPPLERKEMKQLKNKDGHSRSSIYTALCSQRAKVFCAKAGGGRVLGKLSTWFHSKEFFLGIRRKAKGLTIYRPLAKGGSPAYWLSEEREAPTFIDNHYQALHNFAQDSIRQVAGLGHTPLELLTAWEAWLYLSLARGLSVLRNPT